MSKNVKVNFGTVLTDLEGKPLKEVAGVQTLQDAFIAVGMSPMLIERALSAVRPFWATGDAPEEKDMTAARVCANALQNPEAAVAGAERVDRMRLAIKIMEVKDGDRLLELKEAEIATIKKSVEKAYASPLVYMRIHDLLAEDSPEPVKREVMH